MADVEAAEERRVQAAAAVAVEERHEMATIPDRHLGLCLSARLGECGNGVYHQEEEDHG